MKSRAWKTSQLKSKTAIGLTSVGGEFLSSGEDSKGKLWVAAKDKDCNISASTFCFSMGSGVWEEGNDARSTIKDMDQPWLAFKMIDASAPVMFEVDGKCGNAPEAVKQIAKSKANQVLTLGELLTELENHGEARSTLAI